MTFIAISAISTGPVLEITLNRPDVRNAMSLAMVEELRQALRKDRDLLLHGRETGRVVRLPHGEYIEVHEPVDKYELWKLVDFKDYQPTMARPNSKGVITVSARLRAALSSFYFEDRIAPVTMNELESQKH